MLQNPTNQTLFLSTDLVNLTSSFSKSVCRCSLLFGRKKQMPRQAGVWGRGQGGAMVPARRSLWPRAHVAAQGLHDVYLLSLGEVEDFFGSWANNLIVLTDREQRLENKTRVMHQNEKIPHKVKIWIKVIPPN